MSSHKLRDSERRFFKEDYAIVLDFLPRGNPVDTHHPTHRVKPIAQAIGDKYFTLMEFHPKPGIYLQQGERVLVSFSLRELRDKVDYVWGGIVTYDDLTSVAKSYLPEAIRKIVMDKERVFVEFFNIAEPITLKLHALELLPGIGKKSMWLILDERKKRPFNSFDDIQQRTKIIDPAKLVIDRIIIELQNRDRYYIFLEPPPHSTNVIFINYLKKLYEKFNIT